MTYNGIYYTLKETAQGWKITIGTEKIDGYFADQGAADSFAKGWIDNPPPLLKDIQLGELTNGK